MLNSSGMYIKSYWHVYKVILHTLTFWMREFKLLSFLWGHLMILSCLHLLLSTVNPTFICFAASDIGIWKCFWISSNPKTELLFLFLPFLNNLNFFSSSSSFQLDENSGLSIISLIPLSSSFNFIILVQISVSNSKILLSQWNGNECELKSKSPSSSKGGSSSNPLSKKKKKFNMFLVLIHCILCTIKMFVLIPILLTLAHFDFTL